MVLTFISCEDLAANSPEQGKSVSQPELPSLTKKPLGTPSLGLLFCAQAHQPFNACRKGSSAPSLQLVSALHAASMWARGDEAQTRNTTIRGLKEKEF